MVDLFTLIRDYLFDHEGKLRQLLTWFLNFVMEEGA